MSRSRRGGRRGEAVIGPATGCRDGGNATRGHLGSSRSWSANDGPESIGRIGNPTRRFFHIKGPGNHRASLPRNQRKHVEPGCSVHGPGKWTSFGASSLDQLGSVLFSEHPPLLRQYSLFFLFFYFFSPPTLSLSRSLSLTSSTIRVRPPIYTLHTFFLCLPLFFFFFLFLSPSLSSMSRATIIDRFASVSQVVILTAALKHTYYYYITRPCAYMFSLYIYIHVYILLLLLPSRIYIYEHIATRAHTHYCYMCIRIYTHTTHILYNRVIC